MFDNYPSQPNSQPNVPNGPATANQPQPVDIFANVGQVPSGQAMPQSAPMIYGPQQFSTMPGVNLSNSHENSGSLKYLIIGIVTLLMVLGGAVLVYQTVLKPKFQAQTSKPETEALLETQKPLNDDLPVPGEATETTEANATSSVNTDTELTSDTQIVPAPSTEATESAVVEATPSGAPIDTTPKLDTDNDGLLDDAEALIGTNPTLADSDADGLDDSKEQNIKTDPLIKDTDMDGLSDGEELNTYQTDPLVKDTDADGYNDGQEVKNGYNPKGSGRLTVTQK